MVSINGREHRCGRSLRDTVLPFLLAIGIGSAAVSVAQEPIPPIEPVPEDSTIARLILETLQEDPPQTVDQQLDAVRILLTIHQDAMALDYLKAVAALQLSGDELRRIHSHFGSVFFLELAADRRVADVAQGLLERIFEAVRAETAAPTALADHIQQLATGNSDQVRVARDAFRTAGDWGVVALLQAMVSDDTAPANRAQLQATLLELGPNHPEPVLAAARSAEMPLRQVALELLMAMNLDDATSTRVLPHSVGQNVGDSAWGSLGLPRANRASDRAELRRRMTDEIRRLWHRAGSRDDTAVLWFWDHESGTLAPREMTGAIADFVVASQIAEDWMSVDPFAEDAQEFYLGSILAALQWSHGLDRAIPDGRERQFAVASPPQRIGRVLDRALEERLEASAVAACQILALQGDPSVMAGESPLMRALRDPNARVRFAALLACTQLAPEPTLRGALDIWNEAWRILATRGERRVMIVDPNGQRAARIASLASQAGWTATVPRDSRECIRILRQSPDFEFIVIHDDLRTPSWTELAQQLQFDHWTADLPIAILYNVDEPRRETVELAVLQFPVPVDAATWQSLTHRAFPAGLPPATVFRRLERARQIRPWVQRAVENRAWQSIDGLQSVDRPFVPEP